MATVTIAEETNTVTVSEDAETVTVVSGTFTVSSGGGGGATNLAYTSSATNGIVTSDTGTDATLPLATASIAGLLTPAQFSKLALLSGTNTGDQDLSSYATTAAVAAAYQPLDSDLTAIAALSTVSFGRSALTWADAAAGRTALALGTLATQSGTFSGTSSGTNTGDQNLSGYALLSGNLSQFAPTTSAQLRGVISDESGTGALLFAGGNIGDATGTSLTVTDSLTGETSLQSGVPTVSEGMIFFWNSGNAFFQGLSAKTGASADVLIELPTTAGTTGQYLKTTTVGTTATLSWDNPGDVTQTGTQTLTNKTISGASNTLTVRLANDITGFGTGIATALAVNTGAAGAPVLFNGAGGTPSSLVLTNATGIKRIVTFVFDGGGSAPSVGTKAYLRIPQAGTITKVTLLADVSGSAVLDVWKDTYANYPPTVADTITASAKPTISAATKYEDSTLTGWTTSITAGDVLGCNVDSCSTSTRLTLQIEYTTT